MKGIRRVGEDLLRVARVVLRPARALEEAAEQAPILTPGLLLLGAGLCLSAYMLPFASQASMVALASRLGTERLLEMRDAIELGQRVGILLGPVVQAGRWAFSAAILCLAASLFSPAVTYRASLSVVIHASVPQLFLGLYTAVILTLRSAPIIGPDDLMVSSGLDLVLSAPPSIDILLKRLGLFEIWYLLLLWWGLRAAAATSARLAALVVVGYWSAITGWVLIAQKLLATR